METRVRLLNSKSALECDERELLEHNRETEQIINRIIEHEDYDCAYLCKYQDEAHREIPTKILGAPISEIYEQMEMFDSKNGMDIYLDEWGFLVLVIYGQGYEYLGEDDIVKMAVNVVPYNDKKEFLDISNIVLGISDEVRIAKKQFESIYS